MRTESPLVSTRPHLAVVSAEQTAQAPVEVLGESIAALAAQIHAATYELLVLLREFDERRGWNHGFLSCAHWLHWRTGINLGAAREKVRVAKALSALPHLSEAMRCGRLSYAKVRAVTRVATPAAEERLLNVALAATASQVERLVRAWRHADRVEASKRAAARHLSRHLTTWLDDDGMVVIRGRLTPDAGALVCRALEVASDRLFRDSATCAQGRTVSDETTSAQRRADAIALLAEAALDADFERGCAADHVQVVLHVDAGSATHEEGQTQGPPLAHFDGVLEVGMSAVRVSAEASARLACDASVVEMRDEHGSPFASRKTRTVPASIRRALTARDVTCQFPGCTARRCDAHHIVHWVDGGATSFDNLVRLCRRHHRAVHEGGHRIERRGDGFAVFDSQGRHIEPAPAQAAIAGARLLSDTIRRLGACGVEIGARSAPVWDGTRFDLGWGLTVVHQ